MFRLAREIYSIIEMIFSRTGSFRRTRNVAPSAGYAETPSGAGQTDQIHIFIGVIGREAMAERMAAD